MRSLHPICVLEQRATWKTPSMLIYANEAFAALSNYHMVCLISTHYFIIILLFISTIFSFAG
jgi:hypothetical protein